MMQSGTLSPTALGWVREDLDRELDKVRLQVESIASNPDSGSVVYEGTAERLQDLNLIFETLVLDGARQVTGEMHRLVSGLGNGGVSDREAAGSALLDAMVVLPGYLDRLQAGHQDLPLLLLPLINQLRASVGEDALSEGTVFTPLLDVELPELDFVRKPGYDEPFEFLTNRLHRQFDKALENWLQEPDDTALLSPMQGICETLRHRVQRYDLKRLWWVATEVFGGLMEGHVSNDVHLRRLLARVARLIRTMADEGEDGIDERTSSSVTQALLFHIGNAEPGCDGVDLVRERFELEELAPDSDAMMRAQGTLSGRDRDMFRSLSAAVEDELAMVKDALDLELRTGEVEEDKRRHSMEALQRLADTLAMLGLSGPGRHIADLVPRFEETAGADRGEREAALEKLAEKLLLVESALEEQIETLGESRGPEQDEDEEESHIALSSHERRRIRAAILDECVVSMHAAEDAVRERFTGAAGGDPEEPLAQISGALVMVGDRSTAALTDKLSDTLRDIVKRTRDGLELASQDKETVADAMAALEIYLSALRDQRSDAGRYADLVRARLDTIAASLSTGTGASPVTALETARAAVAEPVDQADSAAGSAEMVDEPESHDSTADDSQPAASDSTLDRETSGESAGDVGSDIDALAAESPHVEPDVPAADAAAHTDAPDMEDSISEDSDRESLDTESSDTEAAPAAPEQPSEAPAMASDEAPPAQEMEDQLPPEIDPELREIFLEEYEEVLQSLQGAIPTWINQFDNAEALTDIRRAFHTLKGSGRMVGADELGDFSWNVEDMLNTLLEGRGENFADASVMVRLAEASLPALRQRLLQEQAGLTGNLIRDIGSVAEQLARNETADWDELKPRLPQYLAGLLPGGFDESGPTTREDDGDSEMNEMLRNELAEHLAPVRELMDAIAQNRETRTSDDQVRAVHTIAGALAMQPEGLDAAVARSLENMLEAQARTGTAFTPDAMFTVISAVGQLQNRLDRLHGAGDLSAEEEQRELIDQLDQLTPQFDGPATPHTPSEGARTTEPTKEFDPGHSVFGGAALTDVEDGDAPGEEEITFEPARVDAPPEPEPERPESLEATPAAETPDDALTTDPGFEAEAFDKSGPDAEPGTGLEGETTEEPDEIEASPDSATDVPPLPEAPQAPASAAPAFEPPAEPRPTEPAAPVAEAPSEELDQEIVGIFLEEAAEVLERGENALNEWRDDLQNLDWVKELQREIHTFKGGARMAGLSSIGDFTHEMEELLERIADRAEDPSLSAVQVLEDASDRLHGWVDQVEQGQVPDASGPLELLKQQIQGLGDVTPGAVPAPAPQDAPVREEGPLDETAAQESPAPAPLEAAPAPAPVADREAADDPASGGTIKVAAELLDRLVNASGEVSIYRSRLEQQVGKLKSNLGEFDETINRLGEQFRKMDIEIEAQIRANYPDALEAQGANFDPLELDQFSALQQATRSLQESVSDLLSLQEMAEENLRASEQLLTRQSRVSTELQEGLMKTRMVPFSTISPRLRRIVRGAAKGEQKQARLQLRMVGSSDELDRNVLEHITVPLEHMVRNAVAHGIEAPELRQERNKPAEGEITITVESEATEFVIRIADDGGGIDCEAIRRRAVERGLLEPHEEPTRQQLYAFMMDSGFSTSSSVTQLAGRGVGMDVVNSDIKQIGGSLEIDSEEGKGTQFTIRIPFTLAIMQAIGLEAGDARYLLPLSSVMGVSRIMPDDYTKLVEEERPVYRFAGQEYPVLDIEPLLGERPTPLGRDNVSLLILSAGEQKAAVRVPQLLPHREVVIKPVGPQISSVAGVLGGSISGDGEVMVILDPGPMIRRALVHGVTPPSETAYQPPVNNRRLVLVVDDSITMRKVTSRVLESRDYEVITARDGVDALEQLQDRTPDIMLFDIEMPRMDGYELTERVRDDGRFRSTPIMMITSRAGQKHRDRAMQAGATDYLTKPYREDELLQNVERLLEEAKH